MKNDFRIKKILALLLMFILTFSDSVGVFAVQNVEEIDSDFAEEYLQDDYDDSVVEEELIEEAVAEIVESLSEDEIVIKDEIEEIVSENIVSENEYKTEEDIDIVSENSVTDNYHGYIPDYIEIDSIADDLYDIDSAKAQNAFKEAEEDIDIVTAMPTYYNSVDLGYLKDVRDQTDDGNNPFAQSCWAFASSAVLEANMIKNGIMSNTDDYVSPGAMGYFRYNSTPGEGLNAKLLKDCENGLNTGNYITRGGNPLHTALMLSNRAGFLSESTAPYNVNAGAYNRSWEYKPEMGYMVNSYWTSVDLGQINYMKQMIMDYGAITTNINLIESGIKNRGGKKLYYLADSREISHAITIVGWDDTIPKENFEDAHGGAYSHRTPSINGGWLVRDSYGDEDIYRDHGYFYISYDDGCLNGDKNLYNKAVAFDTSKQSYQNIYQYDGTYNSSYHRENDNSITAANIYTTEANPNGNEILKAVSFSTYNVNSNYEISIYSDVMDMSDPTSGDLVYTDKGSFVYAGIHTIPLNKELVLLGNTKYSVVITISKDGDKCSLLYSTSFSNSAIYGIQGIEEGRSFYLEGSKWIDTSDGISIYDGVDTKKMAGVFRIKAYTENTDKDAEILGNFSVNNVANIKDVMYTSQEIKPNPIVVYNSSILRNGIDYKASYLNNINVGTATMVITGIGSYAKCGTVNKTFKIIPRDLNTLSINGFKNAYGHEIKYIYTGKEIEPVKITLLDGKKTLDLTKQLQIEYTNNINAGVASVKITGKGNYTGKLTTKFTINRRNINDPEIIYTGLEGNYLTRRYDYVYKEIEPELDIANRASKRSIPLVAGKDYIATYEFNIYPGKAVIYLSTPSKSNYCGQKTIYFNIGKRDITKLDISIASAKYNGALQEPKITIKDGTTILRNTIDYYVKYENNQNSGTGKAIISAVPASAYTGSIEKNFAIEKIDLSKAVLEQISNYNYKSGVNVYEQPAMIVRLDDKELIKDVDYKVTYSNNSGLGASDSIAKVTVTGINNYIGSKTASFTIVKGMSSKIVRLDDFTNPDISVKLLTDGHDAHEMIYDGKIKKPEVIVNYRGKALVENEDYTIAFSGDLINRGTAFVDIKAKPGSKQFVGTRRVYFYIIGRPINGEGTVEGGFSVTPPKDVVFNGRMAEPEVTIRYLGKRLVKDRDYTIEYFNNGAVTKNARVVITGIGAYTKSLTFTFAILPFDLSKAKAKKIKKRTYTGYEVCPDQKIAIDKKMVIMPNIEYACTYEENINAGKARVVYTPLSENYTGSRTEVFTIKAKNLKELLKDVDILGIESNYVTSGNEIKPEVTISYNGLEVFQEYNDHPVDVVINYKKNIFPGTASVVIKSVSIKSGGSGNFKGSNKIPFYISGKPFEASWGDSESSNQYTGKQLKPDISGIIVSDGDMELVNKKDYKATYVKNIPGENYGEIILKGKGLYKNQSAVLRYEIIPIEATPENVTVKVKRSIFKGLSVEPEMDVKVNKLKLKMGIDYLISYKNNKGVGKASAVICFIGNYKGAVRATYEIK